MRPAVKPTTFARDDARGRRLDVVGRGIAVRATVPSASAVATPATKSMPP
jgi:hypothetical protein